MADRVQQLQAEYAGIHENVLRECRNDAPDQAWLDTLQRRETAIVRELRQLDARPYPNEAA